MGDKIKKFYKDAKRSLSKFVKTIKYCHKTFHSSIIFLFFDIIWCRIFYRTNLKEYRVFEFPLIDHKKRKTYLVYRKYKKYQKRLYDEDTLHMLNNKILLYKRIVKRKYINIKESSFKEFELFALENKKVLARKTSDSFISSNKTYELKDFRSHAFMLEKIKDDKNYLVEPSFEQDKLLNKISDNLITLIIITLNNKNTTSIISASIKFKDQDKIINGHIDVKNLCIKGSLRDENNNIVNRDLNNYKIPSLEHAFEEVVKASNELNSIKEIEWSVCLTNNKKAYIVDANVSEDLLFEQTPEYLRNRIGLKPYYDKFLNRL